MLEKILGRPPSPSPFVSLSVDFLSVFLSRERERDGECHLLPPPPPPPRSVDFLSDFLSREPELDGERLLPPPAPAPPPPPPRGRERERDRFLPPRVSSALSVVRALAWSRSPPPVLDGRRQISCCAPGRFTDPKIRRISHGA